MLVIYLFFTQSIRNMLVDSYNFGMLQPLLVRKVEEYDGDVNKMIYAATG